MDPALKTALSHPDIDDILLAAVEHADSVMKNYVWRGFRPTPNLEQRFMAGDRTADDFVNEALRRLCDGTRTFNAKRTLLENLNSITDSLIWSDKKSSDRSELMDYRDSKNEDGKATDPISKAVCPEKPADSVFVEKEKSSAQSEAFRMIKASFDGDQDTQNYLDALSEGFFKIEEVSEVTGIPVPKIYEIRRKLKNFAPKFFGVQNYQELERKINEGK